MEGMGAEGRGHPRQVAGNRACLAAGLARKRLSARAEGEALSQSRRRSPRSGTRRSAAAAGVQLPPVIAAKGSVTGWPRLQARRPRRRPGE